MYLRGAMPVFLFCVRRFLQAGAEEMVQELRALATTPKDPVSIPSTHIVDHNYLTPYSGLQTSAHSGA